MNRTAEEKLREPRHLSDRELEQLRRLLRDPSNPTAHDLLMFGGVRTVAGLMARLVVGELEDRVILLTAIRRAIQNAERPAES